MQPHVLDILVERVKSYSQEQITRLYRTLLALHEERLALNADNITKVYLRICSEDGFQGDSEEDTCGMWIRCLILMDSHIPPHKKFFQVLEKANIQLVTDDSDEEESEEEKDDDYSDIHARREGDSIESVDEQDPRWLQAVALDHFRLKSQALSLWRETVKQPSVNDLVVHIEPPHGVHGGGQDEEEYSVEKLAELEAVADQFRDGTLKQKALSHWRVVTAEYMEQERRADSFRRKKDTENVLSKWVLAEREVVLVQVRTANAAQKALDSWRRQTKELQQQEKIADVAAEYFAGRHAFQAMRGKAQERLEQLQEEQEFNKARQRYLIQKYLSIWLERVEQRAKEGLYQSAYKTMRRKVKMNLARDAIRTWHSQAMEEKAKLEEMARMADEFRQRKDREAAQRMALGAIHAMYEQGMDGKRLEQDADQHYHRTLINRFGLWDSRWRAPAMEYKEHENTADKYRELKDLEFAGNKLRNWKTQAWRHQRMEQDADVLHQRHDKRRAAGFLQRWRQAAADHRSNVEAREERDRLVPATPAARRSLLVATSTTPAYTPAPGLLGAGYIEEETEDDVEGETDYDE
ncbi:hypothetical protein PV08_02717 [Exophiala spinifera]|uniref:Sfi1 spindle body domain-containing protein n=1 Tax=Exophiala spinifera TaxID=91928 RepID=A0A0D2C4A6_9EURO|nr:uncharacterized protein PV08_02717 [Exophiala spinifera]KIW18429.1 hypothetical protein PV08_02717 [Exophiala spinifera]